ncbi:ABC transporter ATP-binding protein/permease [Microvirgula aerodenitrificans]|uniref:ABC transporter ATP-binding protein/permease n=1 Tax=Microvirgula aerodenitrificans TaxID=57480 RepID=UPI002F41936F
MSVARPVIGNVWGLVRPYWSGDDRRRAWGLLLTVMVLNLALIAIEVGFNNWNNSFYNALQNLDGGAFRRALLEFCALAAAFILVAVYAQYLQQMLQIRWRQWLTRFVLDQWLGNQAYYRIAQLDPPVDNPDQRIAEDINQFTANTLDLSLGLMRAVVTLLSFLTILWTLSGTLSFAMAGRIVSIPGYMVWVALLYSIAGSWLALKIGYPLIRLNFQQQRYEADFRFGLIRVRENAEAVALYRGEQAEHGELGRRFGLLFDNFYQLMRRQKRLTWFTSAYGQIAIIFPILVAAPRYFAKEIHLGGLMQTVSAFGQVQGAMSWLVSAYPAVADWKATVDRLMTFERGIRRADALEPVEPQCCGNRLAVHGLTLFTPDRRILLEQVQFSLAAGDSLWMRGPSGCGKSTLLKALAGIWPYASGQICLPVAQRVRFLSQRPYLPLGSLRAALCYPAKAGAIDDRQLVAILHEVGLVHFSNRLDSCESWAHVMSLGEQQRIALARVLLDPPDVLCLDEASSALDESMELLLYARIAVVMRDGILLSVGHRAGLGQHHRATLDVSRFMPAEPASAIRAMA